MILALQRFGIEPQDAVDRLDKAWAKHRALQQLDLRGQQVQARRITCDEGDVTARGCKLLGGEHGLDAADAVDNYRRILEIVGQVAGSAGV